jgi:hypothetical protein
VAVSANEDLLHLLNERNNAMTNDRLRIALIDPASVFASPMAVVDDSQLTTENKIEVLRRWEYDAREVQVAIEEGFPAHMPSSQLHSVHDALRHLGFDPDTENTPPTKQGGV